MYLKVTVFPGIKKELIEKTPPGLPLAGEEKIPQYKMYIREEAERGQANKRVLKILQELYPRKRIRIVTGARSLKKLIEIK